VTVAELHALLTKPGGGEEKERLREHLEGRSKGLHWNGNSIGWLLRRYKDKIVGGRCFRATGESPVQWKLEGVAEKKDGGAETQPNEAADEPDDTLPVEEPDDTLLIEEPDY
jgi:hypothetical protein